MMFIAYLIDASTVAREYFIQTLSHVSCFLFQHGSGKKHHLTIYILVFWRKQNTNKQTTNTQTDKVANHNFGFFRLDIIIIMLMMMHKMLQ